MGSRRALYSNVLSTVSGCSLHDRLPVKAISRDEKLSRVMVDHNICIGCRSCVTVCPFGAMGFNVIDRKNFKCDLCDGDPQCVRFCEVKAVDYMEADRVSISKKKRPPRKSPLPKDKRLR